MQASSGAIELPVTTVSVAETSTPLPRLSGQIDSDAASASPLESASFLWDVFISHKRSDAADFCRVLYESLLSRGYRVFLDVEDNSSLTSLLEHVTRSRTLLFVLSPEVFHSVWCVAELRTAMQARNPILHVVQHGALWRTDDGQVHDFPPSSLIPIEVVAAFTSVAIPYRREFHAAAMDKIVERIGAPVIGHRPSLTEVKSKSGVANSDLQKLLALEQIVRNQQLREEENERKRLELANRCSRAFLLSLRWVFHLIIIALLLLLQMDLNDFGDVTFPHDPKSTMSWAYGSLVIIRETSTLGTIHCSTDDNNSVNGTALFENGRAYASLHLSHCDQVLQILSCRYVALVAAAALLLMELTLTVWTWATKRGSVKVQQEPNSSLSSSAGQSKLSDTAISSPAIAASLYRFSSPSSSMHPRWPKLLRATAGAILMVATVLAMLHTLFLLTIGVDGSWQWAPDSNNGGAELFSFRSKLRFSSYFPLIAGALMFLRLLFEGAAAITLWQTTIVSQ